jgi:hypothetical protein
VPDKELSRGLPHLARLVGGVAFLEVQTLDDSFTGDRKNWIPRTARRYRVLFRRAGLVPCGLHLWLGPQAASISSALERG